VTSFLFLENYSPILDFLIGTASFLGFYGIGVGILKAARLQLPSPWVEIASVLLGIEAQSLAVQIAGYSGALSTSALKGLWFGQAAIGAAFTFYRFHGLRTLIPPRVSVYASALIAAVGLGSLANLVAAIAPSTKIDELFYHMLVPSRLVVDQAFHFYPWPWQAAILPQMIYQIALAPVHAIGFPDAGNVVSWWISIALVWFAWCIIRKSSRDIYWTALWVASICIGMYPVVWQVTGGAHSMGDLAVVAAVVAIAERDRSLKSLDPAAYGALASIFALAAASSKVTLLPVSIAVVLFVCWSLLRTGEFLQRGRVLSAIAAPWLIFYLPILAWTFIQSGSPFGPMLAGVFGASSYSESLMQSELKGGMEKLPLTEAAWLTFVSYSPLIWIGAAGAFFCRDLPGNVRAFLASVTCLQLLLLVLFLPNDVRYLGGLHFGLLVVFATRVSAKASYFANSRPIVIPVLALAPWLAVQWYYAKQFIPVSLGLERTSFYERYIPFYSDFIKLNDILPRDAALLVDFRLGNVYSPRPVVFSLFEMPPGKRVFFFGAPETIVKMRSAKEISELAPIVYENKAAIVETFRTPGRASTVGPVQVVEIANR